MPQYTYELPPPMLVTVTNPGDLAFPPAAQTKLDEIETAVDGLEAALTTLSGQVDGLEGFTDGIEASLTTLIGHVDGLEASLTTLAGHVDTLEALLAKPTTTVQANNDDVDSGASEALTVTSLVPTGPVIVKAYVANTGNIYVSFNGTDAAITAGIHLGPGEQTIGYVANLNLIKVRASVDNQGVSATAPG